MKTFNSKSLSVLTLAMGLVLIFMAFSNVPQAVAENDMVVKSLDTPDDNPRGLAWDGQYLWHVDPNFEGTIYQIDPADGSVVKSLETPAGCPMGLAWDGQYLWNSDYDSKMIYQIDPADGSVVKSFEAPDTPEGLAWDGQYLWNAGSASVELEYKIHKIDTAKASLGYTLTTSTDPSDGGSISLDPSEEAYDEGTTVTVTADPASGYEFDHWSGDASGSSSSIDITMDSDKSLTANFVEVSEEEEPTGGEEEPTGGEEEPVGEEEGGGGLPLIWIGLGVVVLVAIIVAIVYRR